MCCGQWAVCQIGAIPSVVSSLNHLKKSQSQVQSQFLKNVRFVETQCIASLQIEHFSTQNLEPVAVDSGRLSTQSAEQYYRFPLKKFTSNSFALSASIPLLISVFGCKSWPYREYPIFGSEAA